MSDLLHALRSLTYAHIRDFYLKLNLHWSQHSFLHWQRHNLLAQKTDRHPCTENSTVYKHLNQHYILHSFSTVYSHSLQHRLQLNNGTGTRIENSTASIARFQHSNSHGTQHYLSKLLQHMVLCLSSELQHSTASGIGSGFTAQLHRLQRHGFSTTNSTTSWIFFSTFNRTVLNIPCIPNRFTAVARA